MFEVFLGDSTLLGRKDMLTFCNEHLKKEFGFIIHANGFKNLYEDDGSLSRACIVKISANPIPEKRRHEKVTSSSLEQHRKRRIRTTHPNHSTPTIHYPARCSDGDNVDDSSISIDAAQINKDRIKIISRRGYTLSDKCNDKSFTIQEVESASCNKLQKDIRCDDSVNEGVAIKMESDEECSI